MEVIKLHDKEFKIYLQQNQIAEIITDLGKVISNELRDKDVIFLAILNGSFMFAADLFREIDFNCKITFLKLSSYQGQSSTGTIKELIGFNEEIANKTVVILEDIVDTGNTLVTIYEQLKAKNPAEIKLATLLYKPETYSKNIPINYIGLNIPNLFVVGYGLDYDGLGRNLKNIYTLIE